MWRADRTSRIVDDETPEDLVPADVQVTSPQTLSVGEPGVVPGNSATPVWSAWREELGGVGGRSPLVHFDDSPRTRIELSTTHPGGLAQFITGKTTLLSSLIRDDLALRAAKNAASAITAKGTELATTRGIDAVHLGVGIASWSFGNENFIAPVLLRPLAIRRHGRDFEVKLRGSAYLNPGLARALDRQYGIRLDAASFAALADDDGTFKPNSVIDRLRGLTSHLENFAVSPRLVVSTFAEVASDLVSDAADLQHPLLDAVAGNASAIEALRDAYSPVVPVPSDERTPQTDSLLLDADPEQETVVAQITAGNSLVVRTLPGTGGTQTIVNTLGTLVAQNRRVLVVSPRRASLASIAQRLADIALPGLAVTPRSLRRDIIRSISRSEKVRQPAVGEVDEALLRLRSVLLDYRGALSRVDPLSKVSVLDCVAELSRLALLPDPPTTTARLSRHAVERLATDRAAAAQTMVAAAELGEFRYGPGDSPWYGAQFDSGVEALQAHEVAKRVNTELPALLESGRRLVGSTHMRAFLNLNELGLYLRLFVDLRDTLDRFVPAVFDRSLSEVIAATAPRKDFPDMSGGNRRRLKKLALEYVRPGVRVPDLHEALVRIQQQRVLWHRFVAEGAVPAVPVGIAEVQQAYQRVMGDLATLNRPLGYDTPERQLGAMAIADLIETIGGLAEESDVLHNLQDRTALMSDLRDSDLDPLIADFARRHVPQERVAAELELAWWKSALETLLESDRALLGANTEVLDRLEADFRLVDEAHAAGNAQLLAWQLGETWKIGLVDWPEEAAALKSLLGQGVTPRQLQDAAPHLSRSVAPVWLVSPYEVPLLADMTFDAVVLVDAGAMTIAEAAGAIRRGKQIVAFGDPVTQTPTRFETAITEFPVDQPDDAEDRHADSVLARLATLLPTLTLSRSYRPGGEDLAELVNRRFYSGRIESLPWAGTFLGHGSLALDYVTDGHGMPDPDSGAVESPDAEVERVVDLVLDHAHKRPTESLMVVTASAVHAVRVSQAVLDQVSKFPELVDVLIGDRPEPFTVATIEQAVALSRDRVIFSVGYGRTPHGRVLSDFGALGEVGGERLLAVAMTRARRSMVIVSSFEPEHLEDARMQHGASALAEILAEVGARQSQEIVEDISEPMLLDLADRLQERGINVALGHRGKLGLVASRGGICLAIETDSDLHERSLRESLRLRPELLRRLGWHYLRVHAFDLFADPNGVADRVARMLGIEPAPVADAAAQPVAEVPARAERPAHPEPRTQHQPSARPAPSMGMTAVHDVAETLRAQREAALPRPLTPEQVAARAAAAEPVTEPIPIITDSAFAPEK